MVLEIIDKELLKDVLDDMVWSFSRLNAFHTCKRMFYKTYILGDETEDNFFAQYGSFVHGILEKYSKGELELFDLVDYYKKNFDEYITEEAPPNNYVDLHDQYYKKGLRYLENFQGFQDEAIGTEQKIDIELELSNMTIKFIGYIDRLSKTEDGEYKILDHKSKSAFKSDKELKEYLRQLYLYSLYVKKVYEKYPKILEFNMFKENDTVTCEFSENDLEESLKWVEDTINSIYEEEDFLPKSEDPYNDFFCRYICGYKGLCI